MSTRNIRNKNRSRRTVPRALLSAVALGCVLASHALFAQVERQAIIPSAQGAGNIKPPDAVGSVGELSIEPIAAGQTVHVSVFNASDFSITARVSETGEIPYPMLGVVKVGGLTSAEAARLAAILPNPHKWKAAHPGRYVARRAASLQGRSAMVVRDGLNFCVR